jgi:hypothetical protein
MDKIYAKGSALLSATGLTPLDALGFCAWLTEVHSGSGEWHFRLPVENEIHEQNYLESSGFWFMQHKERKTPESRIPLSMWKNPKLAWPTTPEEYVRKNSQQDIKNVISFVHTQNRNIEGIGDEYEEVNNTIRRIYQNLPQNDPILSDTANELYKIITTSSLSRVVDFGYNEFDVDAFDQSISDSIDLAKNKDFKNALMEALHLFSNLFRSDKKNMSRYKFLYLAFIFEFLVKWIERNNTFLMRIKTDGFKKKTANLIDHYLDHLVVYARQNDVVPAFEGLIIVKEERESLGVTAIGGS